VLDHNRHPVAAVAVTYPTGEPHGEIADLAASVRRTADALTTRLGGRPG
jgi:DNA-binding IclR family transcriptional regulator